MPNIKLNYRYCDYANYKNNNEVIFTNPANLTLEQVEASLLPKLLDDNLFYSSRWGLKDMHFEKWDDEDDHPYHEYMGIEYTEELPTETFTIEEFAKQVKDSFP